MRQIRLNRTRTVLILSLCAAGSAFYGIGCDIYGPPASLPPDTSPPDDVVEEPDDMPPAPDDDAGVGDLSISYARQIQPIFDLSCAVCHAQGGFADFRGIDLRLTQEESYDLLINQPSVQRSDLTLVVPGDPEASLLFQKVDSDTPSVGVRMPFGRAPLADDDIELIRLWIEQGAVNN